MMRAVSKLLSLLTVLVIGAGVLLLYRTHTAEDRKTAELENENQQLQRVVGRLTDERRVAEMMVTGQSIENGIPRTTLLFVEYARDRHATLPPKMFTISGNQVHLDAMVIKFEHGFVQEDNPLRGHTIALFTRIFGNHQSPDDGFTIDAPGQIPGYYEGSDPRVSAFETDLWSHFWRLTSDSAYRKEMGVRVSNGQGLWWPCEINQLYTITIETDGGLNVTSEPVKGIYREALRQKSGS